MNMKPKRINGSGHVLIYKPDHPSAYTSKNWLGYVYEHRLVAERILGRPLISGEVVHHLDGDPSNNSWENLLVLSDAMHKRLHDWMDKNGVTSMETAGENGVNSGKPKLHETLRCKICDLPIRKTSKSYCSIGCKRLHISLSSNCPAVEILKLDISNMSWVAVGKKYGVSDNAVRKWVNKYIKEGVWQS